MVLDPSYITAPSSVNNADIPRWTSPELLYPEDFNLEDSQPTNASDCYALGMVILEVLSGRAPYNQVQNVNVLLMVIRRGEPPKRPEGLRFTDDLWRTLGQCWSHRPEDRPAIGAVLECLGWLATARQPLPPGLEGNEVTVAVKLVHTVSHY